MNINLINATDDLKQGLDCFLKHYDFEGDCTIDITVSRMDKSDTTADCIKVSTADSTSKNRSFRVEYREIAHFFRALGIIIEHLDDKDFTTTQSATFKYCSNMIDLSRNSVCTVNEMKKLLTYMAITGHNRCYLYMEDTYEIEGYPYFGYLRGRYTASEMRAIDDFAFALGIEAVPCIQTLAHLRTALKWNYATNMRDTGDIMLVGSEDTYNLIEAMFVELKSIFRTNLIHIGMDEAGELGTGNYLRKNGFKPQHDLMLEHLNAVNALAIKHELKPMIWDDMFFRALDANQNYYNKDIDLTDEYIAKTPKNVALVYWDYYHNKLEDYEAMLCLRDRFENDIVFAGGIWRWMGFVPGYSKTFVITNAALEACKNHNIDEIMSTAWGDDGAESPIETIIPGLILFAEHCYGQAVDEASISARCKSLTGVSLEEFMVIEQLDILPGGENPNIKTVNPSKYILYQDILLGAFDHYFDREDIQPHYNRVHDELIKIAAHTSKFNQMFIMYAQLARVLAVKSTLGVGLRRAYKAGNKAAIKQLCDSVLPALITDITDFKREYTKVWYAQSKGHGFEVIDVRISGVIGRIHTTITRLSAYLNGEISTIEELEETILPFERGGSTTEAYIPYNNYRDIATQNVVSMA